MKRAIAILVALVFLASGLIRIGVSGLMIGEAAGWWSFGGEAAEALAGTRAFLAEAPMNLLGFSVPAYFAYIGAMGLVVSVGAVGRAASAALGPDLARRLYRDARRAVRQLLDDQPEDLAGGAVGGGDRRAVVGEWRRARVTPIPRDEGDTVSPFVVILKLL